MPENVFFSSQTILPFFKTSVHRDDLVRRERRSALQERACRALVAYSIIPFEKAADKPFRLKLSRVDGDRDVVLRDIERAGHAVTLDGIAEVVCRDLFV